MRLRRLINGDYVCVFQNIGFDSSSQKQPAPAHTVTLNNRWLRLMTILTSVNCLLFDAIKNLFRKILF